MIITKDIVMAAAVIAQLKRNSGPVRLEDIAADEGFSLHFLEQVARKMRLQGFINSIRGPGGGYILANARAITLEDLFKAKYGPAKNPLEQAILTGVSCVIL